MAAQPPGGTRSGRRLAWIVFGLFTADGFLHFGYRHLDAVARGHGQYAGTIFVEELTGSWAGALLFPAIVYLVKRWPLRRGTWAKALPVYLAAMVAVSFLHTTIMWGIREVVWQVAYGRSYDYGDMSVRYFMEGANDVVWFWLFVGVIMGFLAYRGARAREVRQAQLEADLARAEVESLERRLHPHFLFNALNTISTVMYEDPAAADRMIAGLSELLRRALATGGAQEVPLRDELSLLERYLDIMRARFSDRLSVSVEVDDDAKQGLVPPLLLQPLVENAIRHGADPRTHAIDVEVSAERRGPQLVLRVRDRGAGIAGDGQVQHGVGLSTTARRLAALYGDGHRLTLENADGGGLSVTIELPHRSAKPAEAHDARAPG